MRAGFTRLGKLYSSLTRQIHSLPPTDRKFPNGDISKLRSLSEKSLKRPVKISIEGNIGSGKTTLLNYFSQFPCVQTFEEPLDKWRNVQGHNLLGLLYEDMMKWNTCFQSYVQLTRLQVHSTVPEGDVRAQVFERSIQSNRYCFLENSYKKGHILPAQYEVLREWYEWIEARLDISLDLIVYLRTDPNTVYNRVLKRNRSEEKTVTMEYLESVHEALEKWLLDPSISISIITIDANASLPVVTKSYANIFQNILEITHNKEILNKKTEKEVH